MRPAIWQVGRPSAPSTAGRALARVSALILLAGLAPALTAQSAAATPPNVAPAALAACGSEAPTETAAEALAQRCAEDVEVAGLRTELTRTFVAPTGERRFESAITPQRVRRANGSWDPISTTLVRRTDGSLGAEASTADIAFSAGGSGPLVTWRSNGSAFTLAWPSALPAPRLDGASATYDEVLPGVALHVTATADGFRHAIEVKTAEAAKNPLLKTIRYQLGGSATRRLGETGGLEVVDASGQVFASGGGGSMWDSSVPGTAAAANAKSRLSAVAEDLASDATRPGAAAVVKPAVVGVSGAELTVQADAAMLADPATTYPVFIDPPMNGLRERWAWANNGNFNTDVENRARVGRNPYDGTLYRSFFNFTISSLHDTTILDAEIKMKLDHSYSCDNSWVWLYRTGGITVSSGARMAWSTRPLPATTIGTWEGHANEAGGCSTIQPDADAVFDNASLRSDLQYAVNPGQHWTNYVAGLCACNDEGDYESSQDRWKKFYTDKTYLVLTYDKAPNAPAPQAFNATTDCYKACSGTATVRTSTPTLIAKASDPYGGTLKTTFEVRATAADTGTLVATNSAAPYSGSSGSNASWKVTASLADNGTYYWRARSKDENNLTGGWSGWQTLKVDKTPPGTPTISSPQYPYKSWSGGPGQGGTFAFAGGTGAYEYTWTVDGGSATTTTTASAAYTPATDMVHTMRVYATDVAGNKSPLLAQNDYQFWVTPVPNRCWNWRLDETGGSTAADTGNTDAGDPICAPIGSTVVAQPGTLAGGVGWGAGYIGNAAVFDGTGQITTGSPVIDSAKSFTVMAWAKPSSLAAAAEQNVLSADGTTASRFALAYRKSANGGAGGWCFVLRDADSAGAGPSSVCATGTVGDSVPPADNKWVHLGGVYDAVTGTLQIHVMGNQDSCNGEMVSAPSGGTPWSAPGSFVIGRGRIDGAAAGYWRGSVDQVYVHQRVLTAAEICQQAIQ
ncbi:LamG domain-containing protein [Actinoplanes bogorensis]|uniref:LamG domain-containing protein n=1 Tax=Paractinoplanes bogorensis TaxID=1610840 RepID=A0ABS5Z453_9ACTN|nr:LamG-like jellyroll fold domain-containing protein [Actinoplanes bogorensis]MBU2670462.1 LamG domain-containing protein [Actinoplanes bogorensis]